MLKGSIHTDDLSPGRLIVELIRVVGIQIKKGEILRKFLSKMSVVFGFRLDSCWLGFF